MPTQVPRHVACIMGGNGRWAGQRGLAAAHGDLASASALKAMFETTEEEGVEWLTLLTPAEQSASAEETSFLLPFFAQHVLGTALERLHSEGVRVRMLGATGPGISEDVRHRLRDAEDLTRGNTRRNLTIAFEHGGRRDVLDAARELIARRVPADKVTADTLPQYMQCPELPDVDLLIRTGGEHRISGFLLWHCADAELVFLDVPWPDFRTDHLRYALDLYRRRHPDQAAADPASGETYPAPAQRPGSGLPADAGVPAGDGLLTKLLRLPGTLATYLGLVLLDGLQETLSYGDPQMNGPDSGLSDGPPSPPAPSGS
ncbi:polyprenyl diphosphate synthase [Streptomyces iconiensis]|uniref:Polyprenyl diphosphate synthase n=1 Tax=Streptomyces iconiensis TaxID=1384038 RepID=A0ABT6ZYT0_9ACTN|nr:polyprenyl diphosphate synthase [Streptomyces iconiensis]MDJ1134219.1 polyprenyl diphosphate synthase [Streptomyces iconiensis]